MARRSPSSPGRRPAPSALRLLVVALGAVALITTACGGSDEDGSSSEKTSEERDATTTTEEVDEKVTKEVADGLMAGARGSLGGQTDTISADTETCIAESLILDLGKDEAVEISEGDLTGLTDDQREAVTTAFDECMDAAEMAGPFTTAFYEGINVGEPPSAEVEECVAAEAQGQVGQILLESIESQEDPTATPATMLAVFDTCIPLEDVVALFTTAFEQAGATPEQAACAADIVAPQVTISDLYELGTSDAGVPDDVQQILNAAKESCT